MNIRISNWVIFAVLFGMGILIIALIRGCNNQRSLHIDNKRMKSATDSLQNKINKDSIDRIASAQEYTIQLQLLNGINEMNVNKLNAAYSDIDKANERINKLLALYQPVQPDSDTNSTLVPNNYIEYCATCFTELPGQQQRIKSLRTEMDVLRFSLSNKIRLQENRIIQLGDENNKIQTSLNNVRSLVKEYETISKPRRTLYLTGGIMGINQYFPNAIGGGLAYQDKRRRIFSLKRYGSEYGPVNDFSVYFPLSLKILNN